MPQQRSKLSCARCQFRKLKCSRTQPCSSCVNAKQECEYRETAKRRPVSRLYVSGLEDRVAWLENLVNRLKAADASERDAILANVDLGDHLVPHGGCETNENNTMEPTSPSTRSYFHIENEGLVAYHGPTSIYRFSLATPPQGPLKPSTNRWAPDTQNLHAQRVAKDFCIDLQGSLVNSSLRQFFKWQYPHFMFIYREAFLRDHFSDREDRRYWSGPLLLAMCALGLVMVPDQDGRAQSDMFFSAAETVLLVSGIGNPCIPTVQAFLCLALYEIGRGNLSSGWRLSGIAFRMAQDLGIPTDPRHRMGTDSETVSLEDIEIGRRIYWGCYISDKIISLLLGRPALLFDDNAEVEITERLPDLPGMEDWLPAGNAKPENGQEHTQQLVPCFQMQISLAKVAQRVLDELCSPKKLQRPVQRKARIDALNLDLCRWEAHLDPSLHFGRWQAAGASMCPSIAALHMLFHSLRIMLNMEASSITHTTDGASDSGEVCLASARVIIAIVRKYRTQCSLKHTPFIFMYGIAKALEVVTRHGIPEEQSYLLQALDECSPTWALAGHVKAHFLGQFQQNNASNKQEK